ncbi:MAG: ribonuclease III [Treponema sp.]|nr:ribonuclease III [Treponema sp.]
MAMKKIFQHDSIPAGRRKALQQFCKNLSIRFSDYALLDLAFHHRSYSNEAAERRHVNNERLEFLGDSVLGMATAAFLYTDMAGTPEGDMARIKSVVVSEQTLAPIARATGIDEMLVLGKGEEMSGGRRKPAILADAVEAVIGAYYLDAGYVAAEKLVLSLIVPEIRKVQENRGARDYKTLLQEFYQKKYKACPVYELVRKTGPDHDQTFWVSVRLGNTTYGPAQGKNKKGAEQHAAQLAYLTVCGE